MKKLLMALVLMVSPVLANDITVDYADTITTADSNTVRVDTVFSDWIRMGTGRFLNLGVHVYADGNDTNWTDDSMFVKLQLNFDGSPNSARTTFEVDTILDVGSLLIQEDLLDADATVLPPYGRLMFIHWDSIGTGEADSALVAGSAIYKKKIKLWYNWR